MAREFRDEDCEYFTVSMVSVWDIPLTLPDIQKLMDGHHPSEVQPSHLVSTEPLNLGDQKVGR